MTNPYDEAKASRHNGAVVCAAAGGKLTAGQRNRLAESSFALPGRRYPINDANHARNALARVAQHGTPEEQSRVRAAVRHKYPGIDVSG